jgi:putative peptidoglycan lipid II flippase
MADSHRQLSRFAAIFAGGTMISRVLGLLRDVAMASYLPVVSREAFTLAFRFPNMLREIIGEGASNAAFVPVFTEYESKKSKEAFRELIGAAMSAMILVLAGLTLAGLLVLRFLPEALGALEPFTGTGAVSEETARLYVSLCLWTFPYLLFIGLAVFAMGPLFAVRHYGTPAWMPALLNITLIVAIVSASRFPEPAYALVAGVWIGGAAQCFVQFRALKKHCGVWLPNFRLFHPGVGRIFWLLGPVIVGQAAGEVNKVVDALFAAALSESIDGVVFSLYCANRLVQLPLSVFGVAIAAAILPSLSASRKKSNEMRGTLSHGLRQSFFFIAPSMLGLIVLREPLVRLMFEHGTFTADHTAVSASALGIYGAGLLSFAWVKVTVTGFYADQDTRTPVIIASGSMLLNVLLNFVLVGPLQYQGLALATTISYTVNFVLLYLLLCVRHGWIGDRSFAWDLLRMTISAVLMAMAAYVVSLQTANLMGVGFASELLQVVLSIAAGAAVYLGLCRLFRIHELDHLASMLRRKK